MTCSPNKDPRNGCADSLPAPGTDLPHRGPPLQKHQSGVEDPLQRVSEVRCAPFLMCCVGYLIFFLQAPYEVSTPIHRG